MKILFDFIRFDIMFKFNQVCLKLGWKPKYSEFDILPLVLQADGKEPEIFEIPSDLAVLVDMIHPT